MEQQNLTIIKRDGTTAPFSMDKITHSIEKAFLSLGSQVGMEALSRILSHIRFYDGITVEDIQNQVEIALMEEKFFDAAKSFMLYRQKHSEDRFTMEQLKFLTGYCHASNAATGSKYDANANVEHKNIATLIGELPKGAFIRLNRKMLTDRIKMLYGKELADRYLELLNNHFIYKNDETSLANYCASITMYPWLLNGTYGIGGNSKAPTNLKSFCGGFINMVFIVSSMLSGACATPEFLMYMNYFVGKEYGKDYYKRANEVVDLSMKKRTIDKIITDCFEQIVYSINQPTGARNFQAVFWNVAYYDKYYFESLFGDFRFPDGEKPDWEGLSWLQKRFMKWFNNERLKAPLTFPVETMALLTENGEPKDAEYGDFTAEMYAEGHSFFTYMSDNADSLSSCCFSKDTKVLWKSSTLGVQMTTLEELHETKWEPGKKNLKIFHNGSWVHGKSIKLPNRPMYKVVTENNKEFVMTDNHLNVTMRGDIPTNELTTDDYLMFNTQMLQAVPENDEHLTYEQGYLVGMFLGDGSFGSTINGAIYETNLSLNKSKCIEADDKIHFGVLDIDSEGKYTVGNEYNNVVPVRISSKHVSAFIRRWTNWQRGTYAHNKELNMDCLLQSVDFRRGILDGWYCTDGGNSNRCYTTSQKLAECMETLITSLGLTSTVDISDRTDEPVVIRGEEFNRNYPLYCVRWYAEANHRVNKDIKRSWIKRNNSIYFKIRSIEPVDYEGEVYCIECKDECEPYFTLPCGLITHNCRLRNEIQDNGFSYTLGAGGVSTGSKSVLTINLNRCVQFAMKRDGEYRGFLNEVIGLCHKVQIAYNENLKELQRCGMLPLFDEGYININRQYLTIGINGLVEAAEYLGLTIANNASYNSFVQDVLGLVEIYNRKYRNKEQGLMFNCEMIPAENVGVKHAKWDKEDGYIVPRDCYNSYFYVVEDENTNIIDKFKLHGEPYIKHLTGGSALHMNLEEHLSKEQYKHLLSVAAKEGCNYFTFNIPNTICNDCGHIDKRMLKECPHCGSTNIDYMTRIIGYLKRVSNFSMARQKEAARRYYAKPGNDA